jgi:hypothetical protein
MARPGSDQAGREDGARAGKLDWRAFLKENDYA